MSISKLQPSLSGQVLATSITATSASTGSAQVNAAATETVEENTENTGSTGTLNFMSTQQNWGQTGGNGMGLARLSFEAQPSNIYDMPDSATPANMPNLPAAKYVAGASDFNVGSDAFAKACSEALYVSEQPGGGAAVQSWLDSFQNPALKAGMQNFLAQNGGRELNDIIDVNGNFNNDLLQQAKAFYPTSNTPAAVSTAGTSGTVSTVSTAATTSTSETTSTAATTSTSETTTTAATTSTSETTTTAATTSTATVGLTESTLAQPVTGTTTTAAATGSTAAPTFGSDAASQAAQAVSQIPADGDVSTTSLNTFAQAALWALNASNKDPNNYQAFLSSIQNPQVKQNITSFVQANAGQSALNADGTYNTDMYNVATYSDPQFGVDESKADQKTAAATLAQPKGDVTPQAFAATAAYLLQEYNEPNHGNYAALLNLCSDPALATALKTAVEGNAGKDPQIDAQGNAQNADLVASLTSSFANAPGHPSTWQAAQTDTQAQQTYAQWAGTSTYPAVQAAAQKVVGDNQALGDAQKQLDTANQGLSLAETNLQAPDASGKMQPLSYWQDQQAQAAKSVQTAWQNSRADEAQFWSSLNDATGGAAQSAYAPYTTNPNYTTEGVMPQGFTSAPLPQPGTGGTASTGATVSTSGTTSTGGTTTTGDTVSTTGTSDGPGVTASTSSTSSTSSTTGTLTSLPTLNAGTTWPANALAQLQDPKAMSSMSQSDFTQLTESFAQLYNQNPAAYFSTLAQVKDPALSGAINFAVNDAALYNAPNLRVNGASDKTEQAQYANYFKDAKAGKFAGWSPSAQTPAGATTAPGPMDPSQLFPAAASGDKWSQNAITAMNAAQPSASNGVNSTVFAGAAAAFSNLYKSNPAQYYQALSQIKDPQLRDGLNYAVLDTLSNHPDKVGNTSWYQGLYGKAGHTGFAGTKDNLTTNSDHTTLKGSGPLAGKPWGQQ